MIFFSFPRLAEDCRIFLSLQKETVQDWRQVQGCVLLMSLAMFCFRSGVL